MSERPFPWHGFALAIATAIGLMVLGMPVLPILLMLLVWAGSLWLVGAAPPPHAKVVFITIIFVL